MPFYSILLSSVLFPPALTLVGQLLLHRPEGLGHVLVLSDVQLQQLQARGAELGQATGPGALGPQTACKHREALLVQAVGQLEAEATVTPCDQHAVAMAVLRGVLSAVPHHLDEKQQQQHGDREAAQGLAQQEGAAHGGDLEDQRTRRRSGRLDVLRTGGLQVWSSGRLGVWRSAGLTVCLLASAHHLLYIGWQGAPEGAVLRVKTH